MPVLVVWGEHDLIPLVSQAREAVAHLRKGSLDLIPDCGYLLWIERPALFVASLSLFLGERADW
jgi:pimeloyl-ACP methyl ester carboxylesterase